MSKRMWTDRSAVFVVRADDGFTPNSPWNFPQTFTEGRLHTTNLPLEDARATVRSLNKAFLEARCANPDAWDHAWALVVACPRSKGWDRRIRVVSCQQAKGGVV